MKIVTFDVADGACSLLVSPNGYSMMIDCGSHGEKACPVESINRMRQPDGWLKEMKGWGTTYPLTLLHITHPDRDHVQNSQAVRERLTPYMMNRRYIEEYPAEHQATVHEYYKERLCKEYRTDIAPQDLPDWGLEENMTFEIPMTEIQRSEILRTKLRNNASRIRIVGHNGFRILFGGDMETEGWEWLLANNQRFKYEISKGITIYSAPHHGHTSGFSAALFSVMGPPKLSILSKGSESDGETDVSSRYSELSEGMVVSQIPTGNDPWKYNTRKSLSTRANGTVYVSVGPDGQPSVYVEKNV